MKLWSFRKRGPDYSQSEWTIFIRELRQRLCGPLMQPSYVIFFVISLLTGATGIWVAIYNAWLATPCQALGLSIFVDARVFNAVITFFTAVGSLA